LPARDAEVWPKGDDKFLPAKDKKFLNRRAIIVANGLINDYDFYKSLFDGKRNFIICADGAAAHLKKLDIMPHLLVGDFDSISEENMDFYKTSGIEIIKFPVMKDMTDTELAVNIAAERGFTEITILGGLGTRADHSLSNIFLIAAMLKRGIKCTIINEHNEIRAIDDKISLQRKENAKVTLLALTEKVTGVTTKGLFYKLEDAVITFGSSFGVSNEFVGDKAEISIKSGLLLVIVARD